MSESTPEIIVKEYKLPGGLIAVILGLVIFSFINCNSTSAYEPEMSATAVGWYVYLKVQDEITPDGLPIESYSEYKRNGRCHVNGKITHNGDTVSYMAVYDDKAGEIRGLHITRP